MSQDPPPRNAVSVLPELVALLEGINPEEIRKAVSAAMILLGGSPVPMGSSSPVTPAHVAPVDEPDGISSKAIHWMSKNQITMAQLENVFAIEPGDIEVIAASMPGSSKKIQTVRHSLSVA